MRSQTEHLSLAELVGYNSGYDAPPIGWKLPKSITRFKFSSGLTVYVKNLRTRLWEEGIVQEYYERGNFLEVKCGERIQKIFSPDHIATKELLLII